MARYVRSINIFIDAKCLVSTNVCMLTIKRLPSAKSLPTTKSLVFTKCLVIDKHLRDKNLSNMTQTWSSNNFGQ